MVKVIWSNRAADDLETIAEYIALDKPDAASAFVATVLRSIEQLADFPRKGRKVPEIRSQRYRELIVPPCRVIYEPQKDAVKIVRILRSEQQLRPDMVSSN